MILKTIRKTIQKPLAASLLMAWASSPLSWSTTSDPSRVAADHRPLAHLEAKLQRMPAHLSEFSPVSEPLALPRCGEVHPPEALLTPDPMLVPSDEDLRVRVSFIVGADGRVHSPFILDSGGPREDQAVLHAVRRWRYRPALCNGVPTDAEARVQFGVR